MFYCFHVKGFGKGHQMMHMYTRSLKGKDEVPEIEMTTKSGASISELLFTASLYISEVLLPRDAYAPAASANFRSCDRRIRHSVNRLLATSAFELQSTLYTYFKQLGQVDINRVYVCETTSTHFGTDRSKTCASRSRDKQSLGTCIQQKIEIETGTSGNQGPGEFPWVPFTIKRKKIPRFPP